MAGRRKTTKPPYKSYAGIPRIVMDNDDFKSLGGNAVKLLLALAYQYRGHNNGDLTIARSVLQRQFGFKSPKTIERARDQLLLAGMIIQTRSWQFLNPGGRCALYALSWVPIDDCPDKQLEVKSNATPPRKFSLEKNNKPCSQTERGSVHKQYRQAGSQP